jgi:gamma-glutamylcyclotransferase (GGCT)/AIG2-like uncharacterized protein YtfP
MKAEYLFVYGTLRRQGGSLWHDYLAAHCQYYGEASFQGRLYLLKGYPGLIASSDPSDKVVGELYRLPGATATYSAEEVLQQLDEYEECSEHFPLPHEYCRAVHTVLTTDQHSTSAWVYLYQWDVCGRHQIQSGDYIRCLQDDMSKQ